MVDGIHSVGFAGERLPELFQALFVFLRYSVRIGNHHRGIVQKVGKGVFKPLFFRSGHGMGTDELPPAVC